jgi:hypothetical protein
VSVATIVNVAVSLTTISSPSTSAANACTVVMLLVALALAAYITVSRQDCVWGFVLCWASFFIAKASSSETARAGDNPSVHATALVVSVLIGLTSALVGGRVALAWRQNRAGNVGDAAGGTGSTQTLVPPSNP